LADVSFGEWLKRQRKAKGLTQEQLASLVNCSTSALRKIEAGERHASVQIIGLFAEVFNIPSSEQKVFVQFARGDLQVASGQFMDETPWHGSSSHRSNLPSPTTSLIGREKEIAEVREYLLKSDIRLITLIGPPGIGKTRLSLESARTTFTDFSDGVFFVPLAPLDKPSLVPSAIMQTLGYVETKAQLVLEQIISGIGNKQILLVLDNFEHLMDGAASLVSNLLSACPRLKIMTTSRESLRVSGEWIYSVSTLQIPKEILSIDMEIASNFPAVTLFAVRARAVRSDFSLNAGNIQSVASICAQLDGLPLAIELIAARIRFMSPQTLLERLNDQFVMSANGMRADSERQKTLQDAIGWSYNLLSAEEQKLFTYLSIFTGGFTLEAVESIFAGLFINKSVSDLIALLLDKSLIQRTLDELGEVHFDMLVTIQQFAMNCLRHNGGENAARDRHLNFFLALAKKADKEVHGPNQLEWMDRLNHEFGNFRAALNWCLSSGQTEACLQLFSALAWTWNVRWSRSEASSWFFKIRAMPGIDGHPENYAQVLNSAGLREWRLGNYSAARSVLEESLAIWLKLGTDGELGRAEALNRLGMVARWGAADTNEAESYFNQSLALFLKREESWGVAWNLFHLGGLAIDCNQNESALSYLQQSLDLYRELGDPWGIARVSQFLGTLYLKQGNYKKAHHYFDQHLRNDERLRFMDGVSVALGNFGELYRLQGDYDQAKKYYEKSLTINREYGMKPDVGVNLYHLGLLALQQNDYSDALRHFTDFFETARTIKEKTSARDLFIGLAAIAAETNQPERAAKLFGAAQTIFEITDDLFSSFDRAIIDRHVQVAQDQLGEAVFEEITMEGRKMTIDQAVSYGLDTQLKQEL